MHPFLFQQGNIKMPLMGTVEELANKNSKVKKWLRAAFKDDGTRNVYGWHLYAVCHKLNVPPDSFLKLLNNGPSPLFLKLKQYLTALSKNHSRKALQIKASVQNFCQYYNDRPQQFRLAIPIQVKATYERPYWAMEEFERVLMEVNPRYRPLLRIGAMVGFGRKELIYLNEHLGDLKPVPGVPEAEWISIPARKSNERFWKAILPAKEAEELRRKGQVMTTWDTPIGEFNVTEQFHRACKRADMRVKGTGVHVLRSIFRTVGGNANIPDKILEQNMGHFDRYHYDRTHEDLTKRATGLMPLWDYFRRGGPEVAQSKDLEQTKGDLEKMQATVQNLEQALEKQRHLSARLIAQEHVLSELNMSLPSFGPRETNATQIRELLNDPKLADVERERLESQLEIVLEEDAFRQRLAEAKKRKEGPLWEHVLKPIQQKPG